jgi:outer membrane protein assembly factor BamB
VAQGRLLVGSGDGRVYCFEATTGRLLWRFRAAPEERRIPVYGELLSTWPVASGVIVEDGIAYFAAGIVNYDGTHVYAVDVETGSLVWHEGTSGHLDPVARTGVCVQGHLLLHEDRLFLAGGTAVSPAVYDKTEGTCYNRPEPLGACEARGSRGWELYLVGERVVACGRPYYSDPRHGVYDADVFSKLLVAPSGDRDVVLQDDRTLACFPRIDRGLLSACVANRGEQGYFSYTWGTFDIPDLEPLWMVPCPGTAAAAVGANAVVLAGESGIRALDLDGGEELWSHPLPASPVPWGLAVDRNGRAVVTLEDGRVLCFGGGA